MASATKVYARLMRAKYPDRGLPLYSPSANPSFPDHYQRGGIYVGDVGFISDDGGFDFLFNLCLPCDHPFNQINGVPDGFNNIPLMVLEEQGYKDVRINREADQKGQVLSTCEATEFELMAQARAAIPGGEVGAGFGIQFSTSGLEGATLVLPHGSWSFDILNGLGRLYPEVLRSWRSWYHFANSKLAQMTSKPLLLVTGFHKASDWCLASYSHNGGSTSMAVSFALKVAHLAGADVSAGYTWQSASSIIGKVGPSHGYEEGKRNQTVFVRGISIAPQSAAIAFVTHSQYHPKITTLPSGIELTRKVPPHPKLSSKISKLFRHSRVHGDGGQSGQGGGTGASGHSSGGQGTSGQPEGSGDHGGGNPGSNDADNDDKKMIHEHPSHIINKFLLSQFPRAEVAITHDNNWMDVFEGKIKEDELIRRVCKKFEPVYDKHERIAYLEPK